MGKLLNSLQSALNKLYDGNTVSSDETKQDGVRHIDYYDCPCGERVSEDEWVDEMKCCKECYMEHWGDMPGHDEVELKIDDR